MVIIQKSGKKFRVITSVLWGSGKGQDLGTSKWRAGSKTKGIKSMCWAGSKTSKMDTYGTALLYFNIADVRPQK